MFGEDVSLEFNKVNGLDLVCRAHQIAMEGYQYFFQQAVCTVWSRRECAIVGVVGAQLLLSVRKFGVDFATGRALESRV